MATATDRRIWLGALAALVALASLVGGDAADWDRLGPQAATEIFEGITYGRELLEPTEEGSGFIHWVRIDLTAPGIGLYITPFDPFARARGWQYRLQRIEDVVRRQRLAVAVNATMFSSDSGWRPRMSGDLARSRQTVVADYLVDHLWPYTRLLWFDDQLTPHLQPRRPPTAAELAQAKWGIAGFPVYLWKGRVGPETGRKPDALSAVAVDRPRKLLFLAVGQHLSPRLLLQRLADLGAKDGFLLDGGGSTAMAIGKGAREIPPGVVFGGKRPVATFLGVKGRPIGGRD
jgi:Phosphodiester glycosidase